VPECSKNFLLRILPAVKKVGYAPAVAAAEPGNSSMVQLTGKPAFEAIHRNRTDCVPERKIGICEEIIDMPFRPFVAQVSERNMAAEPL